VLAGAASYSGRATSFAQSEGRSSRPNILFLFTDQQRWDTIAQAGHEHMITPNLDWLAERGTRFDEMYATFPLCVPNRVSIVTGCFPKRHMVRDNGRWIPDNADTWPQIFTDAGYDTRGIGKMHCWPSMKSRNLIGFSKRVMAEDKYGFEAVDDYALWMKEKGSRRPCPWLDPAECEEYVKGRAAYVFKEPEELHIDSYIGMKAVEALKEVAKGDKPFCHWVSFNSPHAPHDPPQRFLDMYKDRDIPAPIRRPYEPFDKPASRTFLNWVLDKYFAMGGDFFMMTDAQIKKRRSYYYATITLVDEWIGKIIETLKETGLYDNTIIVFSSDHGDAQGDHNMLEKSFFYESMVRVPLLIHCPTRFAPGVSKEFVQSTDIAPTLLSLAGLKVPERMDGKDLSPLLNQASGWKSRDAVFSEGTAFGGLPMTMIRTREWKLVYEEEPTCRELYDMRGAGDELRNVYYELQNKPIRDELEARLKQWRSEGERLFEPNKLLPADYVGHLFPDRDEIPETL
jgi:choline-sulfatase